MTQILHTLNSKFAKLDEKLSDIVTFCLNRENRPKTKKFLLTFTLFIISLILVGGIYTRVRWFMDPIQRYYFKQYIVSQIDLVQSLPLNLDVNFTTLYLINTEESVTSDEIIKTGRFLKSGDIALINVDNNILQVKLADHLTGKVFATSVKMRLGKRRELLQTQIYENKTPLKIFEFELFLTLFASITLIPIPFFINTPKPKSGDRKWISGIKPVTVPGFIHQVKGDGYGINVQENTQKVDFVVKKAFETTLAINHLLQTENLSKKEKNQLKRASKEKRIWKLRIKYKDEGKPLAISGDTGSGKSQVIIQLLLEAQRRGDAVVIYDTEGIYAEYFYSPARGDVIINPYDQRSPQWILRDEISTGDGSTIAESIIANGKANSNDWFFDKAKKITNLILQKNFDNQTLIELFSNIDRLREFVKGTEFEEVLSAKAPEQASGVVSTMTNIATYLRLFNPKAKHWSSSNWTHNRKGWIFITPQQNQQEALRGLNTAIIDLLITRILQLSRVDSADKPVWFIIDELASLKNIPKLMALTTEARKHNCRTVLGFQGYKQLKEFYGDAILTGLAQSCLQIHLRTKEPYDSEYKSRTVSKMLVEKTQVTESTGKNNEKSVSVTTTQDFEFAANESVIATLKDLEAVVVYENFSTKIKIVYTPLEAKNRPFELRKDLMEESERKEKNEPDVKPDQPTSVNTNPLSKGSTEKQSNHNPSPNNPPNQGSRKPENKSEEPENGVAPFPFFNGDQPNPIEGFYKKQGKTDGQYHQKMREHQADLIALTNQLRNPQSTEQSLGKISSGNRWPQREPLEQLYKSDFDLPLKTPGLTDQSEKDENLEENLNKLESNLDPEQPKEKFDSLPKKKELIQKITFFGIKRNN